MWGVKRIVTGDSSFQRMRNSNAANYPGHGNMLGVTSGFETDLIYDLLIGKPISQTLSGGTVLDKIIGQKILEISKQDDLVLRDMGYFSLDEFSAINDMSAFWLSRLPANVAVKILDGKSLEKLLRCRKNNRLDLIVKVAIIDHECRLLP